MTGAKTMSLVEAEPSAAPSLPASPLDFFQQLLATNPSVETVERMTALWERIEAKKAEQAFNAAMSAAQAEMRPIATDADNPQTRSRYASYAALDRALRPIYTKHGFGLSFDTGDAAELTVRVLCYVTHGGGHSRTYKVDMPADGKGAKGGDVMTRTHATGSAVSYGTRYLLKMIFNVAVGESDDDGNRAAARPTPAPSVPEGYDAWIADLESVAIEGTEALEGAWKESPNKFRAHLTKTNPQKWEAVKRVASCMKGAAK